MASCFKTDCINDDIKIPYKVTYISITNELDISELSKGVYFFNIQTSSGKVFSKKLVKN